MAILNILALMVCCSVSGEFGNDQTIKKAFIQHAKEYAEGLTAEKVESQCRKSPENFAWVEFRYLECLNIAYELTGDTAYLDVLKNRFSLFENCLTKGSAPYLGWYGKPLDSRQPEATAPDGRIDELQTSFRAIGLLARWVELAQNNPDYAKANKATIVSYITLMTRDLYPKWDARGFFTTFEGRGGVYHGLDFPSRFDLTLSHEKHAIAVDALLKLHRVTSDDAYLKRALEIGTWFKSCLSVVGDHYEWMSWVPAGKWDIDPNKADAWKVGWIAPDPNGEWYVASLSIALNLYQNGLLFTEEDLARFIATQKTRCWNGDMELPEYRTVAGVKNKWVQGTFLSHQLAHYDPELARLAFQGFHEKEAAQNSSNAWKGGANAQNYVREKFIMQPLVKNTPQPYRQVADRFLSSTNNAAFYKTLFFNTESPGASVPLKPSDSKWRAQ